MFYLLSCVRAYVCVVSDDECHASMTPSYLMLVPMQPPQPAAPVQAAVQAAAAPAAQPNGGMTSYASVPQPATSGVEEQTVSMQVFP